MTARQNPATIAGSFPRIFPPSLRSRRAPGTSPRDLAFCHTEQVSTRVLGVLAGEDTGDEQLVAWARSAEVIYAADSAGSRLIRLGLEPIVVGDLDSFDFALERPGLRMVKDLDSNRTDCDKLLQLVETDGHISLTLAGLEGDLLDHVLSSLTSVARSKLQIRLVLRSGLGLLVKPGQDGRVTDAFGRRISMVPLSECHGATLSGVLWEFANEDMSPGGNFLSISNEGTGPVVARVASGTALLFVGNFPNEGPSWPEATEL